MPIRNPRWLPPQVIVLTQDHMGKYRNIFFSEAIALIEPKLCINHWNDTRPEVLKSMYHSPGYQKNQLVLCKNYVLQW
jgi:hypothetical protein